MITRLLKVRDNSPNCEEYQAIQAPFYYKLADNLVAHIELNSDELGNIKPLDDDSCGEDESDVEQEGSQPVEEVK